MAKNLLEQGTLSLDDSSPYRPTARRMPGYPLWLSAIYAFTGPDYHAAEFGQALLGAGLCLLVYRLAREVFEGGRSIALATAALVALSPPLILMSERLVTEIPFAICLTAGTWASYRWINRGHSGWAVLTGLFWGALALIKPEAIALPIVVLPAMLLTSGRRTQFAMQGVLACAVMAAAIAPWLYRNYVSFGRAGLQVSTTQDEGDADGSGLLRMYRLQVENGFLFWPERWSFLYGDRVDEAQAAYDRAMRQPVRDPSESDVTFFARRPGTFLTYCGIRFLGLMRPASWSETFGLHWDFRNSVHGSSALRLCGTLAKGAMLALDAALLLLGGIGLIASLAPRNRRLWIVTATVLYFIGVYSLLHGINRYRVPLLPLLFLLGVWWVSGRLRRRKLAADGVASAVAA